jgi:hypothetical protein
MFGEPTSLRFRRLRSGVGVARIYLREWYYECK